jgi:hypothetical protein
MASLLPHSELASLAPDLDSLPLVALLLFCCALLTGLAISIVRWSAGSSSCIAVFFVIISVLGLCWLGAAFFPTGHDDGDVDVFYDLVLPAVIIASWIAISILMFYVAVIQSGCYLRDLFGDPRSAKG